jgi:hypothetical protein
MAFTSEQVIFGTGTIGTVLRSRESRIGRRNSSSTLTTHASARRREECMEEMLADTQEKNIHVKLKPAK